MPVRVNEDRVRGEVITVGAVVEQATRSQVIRLRVARDWPPGELAYLTVEERVTTPGAWLPDTAVTEGLRGTWVSYVALPQGDGQAVIEARSVTIHHAAGGRLFVSGALADGEPVVTVGLHRVAPGQTVRTAVSDTLSQTTLPEQRVHRRSTGDPGGVRARSAGHEPGGHRAHAISRRHAGTGGGAGHGAPGERAAEPA